MSRLTLGLFLGCLLTAASAQDLAKKITFACPAAPAKSLLRDLTAATGVPMDAAPTTANDVLVVKVKDVTVDQLMKRIAQAVDGEWRLVGDTYRLERSALTQQRQV